jgi:high-affinity iron transporter
LEAFIQGKVQKALQGKNLFGLASISFVAVFREAFETVLFLRAIWLESGSDAKWAIGSAVLFSLTFIIVLAWIILRYSAKLPVRKLFEASAFIMAALAIILSGKGVHSLQETGALSVTSLPLPFHFDLLGIYPTWETFGSQVMALILMLVLWSYGQQPSAGSKREVGVVIE